MAKFTREEHNVNGVKTVVYTAGKGEPLVFFHGAGTVDGLTSRSLGRQVQGDRAVSPRLWQIGRRSEPQQHA